MSDFVHDFWSWYVAVISIVSILACAVLLWTLSVKRSPGQKTEITGHVWDGDLAEYNNPMPRWWMWLFYITIVFGAIYLVLYPGLGTWSGTLNWTSAGRYDAEMARADERFGPIFEKYAAMDVTQVAADPQAREIGQRLFLNYCSQCHASDARGSRGFPNLADNNWNWGGEPEAIRTTIVDGRQGIMPALGAVLGEEGVKDTAQYVLSIAGMTHDNLRAARGAEHFQTQCAVCHGADGTGNQQLGAPDLTDDVWIYGRGETAIMETIRRGRHGVMPPWGEFLGEEKVHVLTAYVWGLSNVR